jgi:succinate-acetate transporter protein
VVWVLFGDSDVSWRIGNKDTENPLLLGWYLLRWFLFLCWVAIMKAGVAFLFSHMDNNKHGMAWRE